MRRVVLVALVGAVWGLVSCTADAPVPSAPSRSVVSAPHLVAQAKLAGAVFADELGAASALGDRTVTARTVPPDGQLVRDQIAWLARVAAGMAVVRSNVALGIVVSEREARVLGALAHRAWVSTRSVLEAVEIAERPVVDKLRTATPEELRVIRFALGRSEVSLETHLAAGAVRRREMSSAIVAALESPAVKLHDGVSPIPPEALLAAARSSGRILGMLAIEGTVSRHPFSGASDLSRLATLAPLLGVPDATAALRFEVTSSATDPKAIVAPRFAAFLSTRELVDVVLPRATEMTLAEATATLDSRDPTLERLAVANDTLVRAAFVPLSGPLGAREAADGTLAVRLPAHTHQAVVEDLQGVTLLDTPELGPVDIVLAADCFGARISSHEATPGSLAYDTGVDRCREALCGPAVDLLVPRVRDRAACDVCMVRACSDACVRFGPAVPRAEASCSRCKSCPPCAPYVDPGYCGHAQAYCGKQLYECKVACNHEVTAADNVVQCMQSACAEACAQE